MDERGNWINLAQFLSDLLSLATEELKWPHSEMSAEISVPGACEGRLIENLSFSCYKELVDNPSRFKRADKEDMCSKEYLVFRWTYC